MRYVQLQIFPKFFPSKNGLLLGKSIRLAGKRFSRPIIIGHVGTKKMNFGHFESQK